MLFEHKPENKIGVYSIYSKKQDKYYIGYSNNIKRRFYNHISKLKRNKHNNPYLQNSWNKYGIDNFIFSVLCYCPIIEEAAYIEDKLIKDIEKERLFNLNSGGIIKTLSEETKKKISKSLIGNKYSLGNKNALGYRHSEEFKEKISKKHKGNKYCLGYKHSEESKLKMSKIHKGHENNSKKYIITFPNDTKKIIKNLKKFCKENNLYYNGMNKVANGKLGQYKGHKCNLYNEEKI